MLIGTSGDACHPMLPYLAQGANSAIEDGAVLGLLLGAMESSSQLPKALRLYEKLRKTRTEAIARETFKQVRLMKGRIPPTLTESLFPCSADRSAFSHSGSRSICQTGRSKRREMKSFCLSWEKSSRRRSRAGGHVRRSSRGCTVTTRMRKSTMLCGRTQLSRVPCRQEDGRC